MVRKHHNHTLQTNPWHSVRKSPVKTLKNEQATSSLFPSKMIAKTKQGPFTEPSLTMGATNSNRTTALEFTLDMWQLKTLLTIHEGGNLIAKNSVFYCHLSPVCPGDQWLLITLFLTIFDCRLY